MALRSEMQGRQWQIDQASQYAAQTARDNAQPALAQSLHVARFEGHGEVAFAPITFDITFQGEPSFTSGVVLLARPDVSQWRLPVATAFLQNWVQDSKGHYVGAKLIASVFIAPQPNVTPTAAGSCKLLFNLAFTGRAFKGSVGASSSDGRPITAAL